MGEKHLLPVQSPPPQKNNEEISNFSSRAGARLFFYTLHNLLPKIFYKKSKKTV